MTARARPPVEAGPSRKAARSARRAASASRGAPSPATARRDRGLAAAHRASRAAARGLGSKTLTARLAESLQKERLALASFGEPPARSGAGDEGAEGKAALDRGCDDWRREAREEHERTARACLLRIGHGDGLRHRADTLDELVEWLCSLSTETIPRPGPVSHDHPRVLGWCSPATRLHRVAPSPGSLAYHHACRALALRSPFLARAALCGEEHVCGVVDLGCMKCGEVYAIPVGCGLRNWCITCSRKYKSSTRKRIARGLGNAQRDAMERWKAEGKLPGLRPEITLLTFTVSHSGDLQNDHDTIAHGIRGLWKRHGHIDGGSAPYVCAWEMTEGRDGLGHVHAHVAAVWPKRDFRALDRAWSELTQGRGTAVDVVGPGKAAKRARAKGITRSASAGNAASYIAAYVDAGGMSDRVPVPLAAAWLGTMRGQRTWTTSQNVDTHREPEAWTPCCQSEAFCIGYHRGLECVPVDRDEGARSARLTAAPAT